MSSTSVTVTAARPSASSAGFERRARRKRLSLVLGTVLLGLLALAWASPILLLVLTGIRSAADFSAHGEISWPHSLTFENFRSAWGVGQFGTAFRNSGLITLVKVPIGVVISALLSYALAKLHMPYRKLILFILIMGLTVPIFIALVPLFALLRQAGLTDSLWGLLPPYLAFGIPLEVLVLTTFFRSVPNEVLEAARIDGAGEWRIFAGIVLPLSLPALTTVFILDAVATWNELLMALVILSSPGHRTVPLALLNFQGQFTTNFSGLSAGILIALLPILVVYAFLQRFIVAGLSAGAVKG
jgi:raffinose/stachyose/melibiose transport system permease protein